MKAARIVVMGSLAAAMGAVGCGGGSGGGNGSPPADITISGTLSTGSTGLLRSTRHAMELATVVSPLAGYRLYCVTFSSPPVSGTAEADATGVVSLTLAAKDVPFGCFILDADGVGVATLMFGSSSDNAETVSLSGSADLGTITVDSSAGVAQAGVPSGGTLITSTPAGVPCPAGTWSLTQSSTNGTGSGTTWIALVGSGQYSVSYTGVGPGGDLKSFAALPNTYADGTLSIGPFYPDANTENPCASTKTATVTLTINSACTEMTGTITKTGCGSLQCGCEPETITGTKQ